MRGALDQFGDMTFQIVHAGVAFLDETCELLARHENLYATLESTFSYIVTRPDVFERALAGMIAAAGSSRLMFASGINLMHPQPLLAAFETFEFKQATLDRYGIDQLTPQDRANILGENAIRLNGIDRDVLVRNGQAADAAVAGQPRTLQPPWSGLRSRRAHLATS